MSMMRSLTAGVSGLKGFQTKMDVIGNNIANVNTTGFKSSSVAFAEILSQNETKGEARFDSSPSLYNQIGLGVRVASISRDFSQGALSSTNTKTDLAIQGQGYFLINDGEQDLVTRAGNFKFNKDGYLVTENGLNVRGFNATADGTVINGGSAENIQISFGDVFAPVRTQNIYLAGNLSANTSTKQLLIQNNALTVDTNGSLAQTTTDINDLTQTTVDLSVGDTIEFTGTDSAGGAIAITFTYGVANDGTTLADMITTVNAGLTDSTMSLVDGKLQVLANEPSETQIVLSAAEGGTNATGDISFSSFANSVEGSINSKVISNTVYDAQGNAHTLLLTFQQDSINNNQWTLNASFLEGESISAGSSQTLNFDSEGNLINPSSGTYDISFRPGNGSDSSTFSINLADGEVGSMTQYDGSSSANFVKQDGFAKGELTDFYIDANGLLVGTYSNGKSKNLAQIGIATVANNDALEHIGNGLFQLNTQAGDLIVGSAANLPETTVSSGFLENSNVDLATEFTEMIVAQRAYQSNARVITTSDQLLNELTQLKR